MNRVNLATNPLSKSVKTGALLGVTALAIGGGCNHSDAETQAVSAKLLAAPPPPGRAPGVIAGSLPPGAQGAQIAPVAVAPVAVAPVAVAPPAVPPARAPGMMAGSLPPGAQSGAASSEVAPPPTVAPTAIPVAPPKAPYDAATKVKAKVTMVLATPAGQTPRLVPGTLALKAQLKRLWQRGADAKHRGDVAGARKAWLAARRLAPQWPGFQESLDKLG